MGRSFLQDVNGASREREIAPSLAYCVLIWSHTRGIGNNQLLGGQRGNSNKRNRCRREGRKGNKRPRRKDTEVIQQWDRSRESREIRRCRVDQCIDIDSQRLILKLNKIPHGPNDGVELILIVPGQNAIKEMAACHYRLTPMINQRPRALEVAN